MLCPARFLLNFFSPFSRFGCILRQSLSLLVQLLHGPRPFPTLRKSPTVRVSARVGAQRLDTLVLGVTPSLLCPVSARGTVCEPDRARSEVPTPAFLRDHAGSVHPHLRCDGPTGQECSTCVAFLSDREHLPHFLGCPSGAVSCPSDTASSPLARVTSRTLAASSRT